MSRRGAPSSIAPPEVDWEALVAVATEARQRAHAPYSGFPVGAALLTRDGTIFAGCNVENRTSGLTVCAERTAVVTAVTAGHRDFKAIAVVTDTSPPAAPCGMCREALKEFAGDLPVLLASPRGEWREVRLAELLPLPFELPPRH